MHFTLEKYEIHMSADVSELSVDVQIIKERELKPFGRYSALYFYYSTRVR